MPRKGENIYKRKDGRWEGRYKKGRSSTGKTSYGYVYAKTYREVRARLRQVQFAWDQCQPQPTNETILFSHIAEEWFASIQQQLKVSTRNKYHNLLYYYILPAYGPLPLAQITNTFMDQHCKQLLSSGGKRGEGLSPKTVSDTVSLIRIILKFARRQGLHLRCDGSDIHIKQKPKPMRVLSQQEQERLCRYLYAELDGCHLGILLCLFTGLRVGELCALRWEDICFPERALHVNRTLQRVQTHAGSGARTKILVTPPKSPCSIRTIPIPEFLLPVLMEYRGTAQGYLLTNSTSTFIEPRIMQNRFKKALQHAQVEHANFHALRHTFATRCVELGFDVKSLSEILGHASVTITMNRYVHPTFSLKQENMRKLSVLFPVK